MIEPFIWLVWDILAVAIIFRSVYRCAYRGFVSTIVGFLIYVVAAVAAGAVYMRVAGYLYDNIVHDAVLHILTRSFNQALVGSGSAKGIISAMPYALRLLIGDKSADVAAISGDEAGLLAEQVISVALEDPLMTALHAAGFLLVFTIAAFFMRWLARFFTGVNDLPVIGTLNTAMGGIVGVFEGVLSLFVSGFILRLAVTFSGGGLWWLNDSVIMKTYIWRLFY